MPRTSTPNRANLDRYARLPRPALTVTNTAATTADALLLPSRLDALGIPVTAGVLDPLDHLARLDDAVHAVTWPSLADLSARTAAGDPATDADVLAHLAGPTRQGIARNVYADAVPGAVAAVIAAAREDVYPHLPSVFAPAADTLRNLSDAVPEGADLAALLDGGDAGVDLAARVATDGAAALRTIAALTTIRATLDRDTITDRALRLVAWTRTDPDALPHPEGNRARLPLNGGTSAVLAWLDMIRAGAELWCPTPSEQRARWAELVGDWEASNPVRPWVPERATVLDPEGPARFDAAVAAWGQGDDQ